MILNKQKKVRVATRPLARFLRQALRELRIAGSEVTVALVSDQEIARWNEMYRGKKGPTDVLSFPAITGARYRFEEKQSAASLKSRRSIAAKTARLGKRSRRIVSPGKLTAIAPHSLGDIAIAPETARRYATKNGRSLPREMRVLILHGLLHLMGFDHERDTGQMDGIEKKIRRRLGIA